MQLLCQIPLGLAGVRRVLLGALEKGYQHRVVHFLQASRQQLCLNRGSVGLTELTGEQLHFLGKRCHRYASFPIR